ncbi:hypothetical protein RERY_46390 [Rhodococcus erythropolis]|nr:hypothetical protein RERY_46390 [Rhodococcus erythropolis]
MKRSWGFTYSAPRCRSTKHGSPRVETFPHKDGTIVQRGPSVPLVGGGIRGVRAAAGLPTERPEVRRFQGFATPLTATLGAFGRTEGKACACLSGRRRLFRAADITDRLTRSAEWFGERATSASNTARVARQRRVSGQLSNGRTCLGPATVRCLYWQPHVRPAHRTPLSCKTSARHCVIAKQGIFSAG